MDDKLSQANKAALAAASQIGFAEFGTLVDASPPETQGPDIGTPAPQSVAELPPSKPGEFQIPPLGPEEIQMLREVIFARMKQKKDEFVLPDLPITDDDKNRFADAVMQRKPFSEKFSMMGGKLTVTFRTKTKRENDMLFDQLDEDFKANRIRSESKYVTLLNNYNLMMQMTELQGAPCATVLPPPQQDVPPGWSLYKVMRLHLIETLPEANMFLLIGALSQFDTKCRVLAREALKENFSTPVGVS